MLVDLFHWGWWEGGVSFSDELELGMRLYIVERGGGDGAFGWGLGGEEVG